MQTVLTAMAAAFALSGGAPSQSTEAPYGATSQNRQQCFFVNQFQNWRDVDDKTIYIRVNVDDYYRLEMASACPELTYPNPHLITKTVGSDSICSAIDWDLRVSDGASLGSFAVPCIVARMTKLSAAEAAAIPKALKP